MKQRQYKPVKVCIYCGSKGGTLGLTREHTVPFSLGGTLVLPKSSCRKCAEITRDFEQTIARTMLGRLRILFNLPTRNPADRPTFLPVNVEVDGAVQEIAVPVEDHPSVPVLFPVFQLPRLLRGLPPSDTFDGTSEITLLPYLADNEQRLQRIRQRFGKPVNVHTEGHTPVGPFVRLLAKFAHAQAVAEFGLSSFDAFLPSIILGTDTNTAFVIGGYENAEALANAPVVEGAHRILFGLTHGQYRDGDKVLEDTKSTYLIAIVQLFRQLGTPAYLVVVGIPGKALVDELSAATFHREDWTKPAPEGAPIIVSEGKKGESSE